MIYIKQYLFCARTLHNSPRSSRCGYSDKRDVLKFDIKLLENYMRWRTTSPSQILFKYFDIKFQNTYFIRTTPTADAFALLPPSLDYCINKLHIPPSPFPAGN